MTAEWVMYGIKNCDTIKKARRYLEAAGIDYRFHDYRSNGVTDVLLQGFIDQLGWQDLLNTRGTTWRKLPQEARDTVNDAASAKQVMLAQPSMIKRPLLCAPDGSMLLGFSETSYHAFIQEKS
ncbi:ArsC family reductase [Pantoea osteomyelitidis]|uniref:ArsC family reductase n=1 Tax=Pantoea osteomyelitidis TaxID=3230026 RepID=A0ABW7PRL3_9GAMM